MICQSAEMEYLYVGLYPDYAQEAHSIGSYSPVSINEWALSVGFIFLLNLLAIVANCQSIMSSEILNRIMNLVIFSGVSAFNLRVQTF